jgi:ABC-type anion transport system duplicated permease subunit
MKLQIRKAQMTFVDRTFVDPDYVEIHWTHGVDGCFVVVKANIGWKKMLNTAREVKHALQKYLEGKN